MSGNFRFKRFEVSHDGPAMKVGTDGVLLGAWCTVAEGTARALDIGTGTGVIALMLAQRGEGWGMSVDAAEVEAGVAAQARRNFETSPWSDRMRVHNVAVQELAGEAGYELIVSNPPYFDESLLPPDPARMAARHTKLLTHAELAAAAARLLAPEGVLAVVLPYVHAENFIALAGAGGLNLSRRTDVCTTPGAIPKRALLEFRCTPAGACRETLVVQVAHETYTDHYRALTKDFYLKF